MGFFKNLLKDEDYDEDEQLTAEEERVLKKMEKESVKPVHTTKAKPKKVEEVFEASPELLRRGLDTHSAKKVRLKIETIDKLLTACTESQIVAENISEVSMVAKIDDDPRFNEDMEIRETVKDILGMEGNGSMRGIEMVVRIRFYTQIGSKKYPVYYEGSLTAAFDCGMSDLVNTTIDSISDIKKILHMGIVEKLSEFEVDLSYSGYGDTSSATLKLPDAVKKGILAFDEIPYVEKTSMQVNVTTLSTVNPKLDAMISERKAKPTLLDILGITNQK